MHTVTRKLSVSFCAFFVRRFSNENQVGLTPAGVQSLVKKGHHVWWKQMPDLVLALRMKITKQGQPSLRLQQKLGRWDGGQVKEPSLKNMASFADLLLFTYLHMAAAPELADAMVAAKTTGVAYETVRDLDGQLPLLVPMSEVAGRMAVQIGAHFLTKQKVDQSPPRWVPGVPKGKATIIGGGVVHTYIVSPLDSVSK